MSVLPYSESLERQILGAAILDPAVLPNLFRDMTEDDFYLPPHQKIFLALQELYRDGSKIDLELVGRRLVERGQLKEVGGEDYLIALVRSIATTAHYEDHAQLVKTDAGRRKLAKLALTLSEEAINLSEEPLQTAMNGISKLQAIVRRLGTAEQRSWDTVLTEAHKEILGEGVPENKYPTGLGNLDAALAGGFGPGTLAIIDADTSMGKTALAAQIVLRAALNAARIVWFSFEMSTIQMISRFVQHLTGLWIRSHNTVYWKQHPEESDLLAEGIGKLATCHLHVYDNRNLTPLGIQCELEAVRSEHGQIDIFVVDYIQLIQSDVESRGESRAAKMSAAIVNLHKQAGVLKCAGIVGSQISNEARKARAGQHAKPSLPSTTDHKESGDIGGSADYVLSITGQHTFGDEGPVARTIFLSKNRHGPLDTFHCQFSPKRLIFQPRGQGEDDELPF